MAQGTQKDFFAATAPEPPASSGHTREAVESISPEPAPLAARMRPRSLDEYVGQQHILGPGMLLRRAIDIVKSL